MTSEGLPESSFHVGLFTYIYINNYVYIFIYIYVFEKYIFEKGLLSLPSEGMMD